MKYTPFDGGMLSTEEDTDLIVRIKTLASIKISMNPVYDENTSKHKTAIKFFRNFDLPKSCFVTWECDIVTLLFDYRIIFPAKNDKLDMSAFSNHMPFDEFINLTGKK